MGYIWVNIWTFYGFSMVFLRIFYGFSMDCKILTGMNIIELSSCHHRRTTRGQGTAGARNDQLRSCDFRANSLASQMER